MKVLIILNREPYDNTDATWNSLRLAVELAAGSNEVRLFLMNDAVDLARRLQPAGGLRPVAAENAQGVDRKWNDRESLRNLQSRCGIYKNQPYFEGAEKSTMQVLADWVVDSDKVISF